MHGPCHVNLTSARGESRTIEIVLFDFIIPAVGHFLPCTNKV